MYELQGNIIDYFAVFGIGVLTSFTPCVYPVVPLTASFIAGANTQGTKLMGFIISLIYVFGVALTYCTLGVIAALTGKVFGQFQNNPIIFIVVSLVLIFFGLAMFDVIKLPNIGLSVKNKPKPKNIWSIILFGIVSGLVIGPCTAPILGTLLLYVGSKQNIIHAISLLFVFSYGVGASLILIGTFSGMMGRLPKSGPWLIRVKQFCGIILFIAAIYYLFKVGELIL